MNASATSPLPDSVRNVAHLEDLLSEPRDYVADAVRRLEGDFIVLGAAGKMGPTLARMIRRALDLAGRKSTRVMAVSRFSSPDSQRPFLDHGIDVGERGIEIQVLTHGRDRVNFNAASPDFADVGKTKIE